MSELPQLIALARLLDRLKKFAPNDLKKALTQFETRVTSEEAKSLGKQIFQYFESPQNKQVDDNKIQAILELAID